MNDRSKKAWDDVEREKYWNESYVAYWQARVEEANTSSSSASQLVAGDAKASGDDVYFEALRLLAIQASDVALELGCGFGRSLPTLCRMAGHVDAVDISHGMIKLASETCSEKNVKFHVSASETLPFAAASFDVVVCFAAFDAMYQTEALIEMSRVSRRGARVLITGKNDNYCDDDEAGLAAEIGARTKKHPNYFTDVELLVSNIAKFGFRLGVERYYPTRGDFARGSASGERPKMFYEYLLVLEKFADCSVTDALEIAHAESRTHARRALMAGR